MKILGKYKNGNVLTTIYDDGTRINYSDDDKFNFAFPMSIDISITEKCDGGCKFCYMNCTAEGKHADLNQKFLDTIRPFTEIAINGNDMSHPGLLDFLKRMKEKQVIVNITVNQIHFMKYKGLLKKLSDDKLIKGLGVSLRNTNDEFIKEIKEFPNAVIHVINGIFNEDDLIALRNHDLKILVLGYKLINRGLEHYNNYGVEIENNMNWLKNMLDIIISKNYFKVICFDNLAVKQLDVKSLLTDREWEEFYAGDDGTATMFVDMVNKKFAVSSTLVKTTSENILDNIDEMFNIVKKKKLA